MNELSDNTMSPTGKKAIYFSFPVEFPADVIPT
jgi:hypothetical protein